MKLLKYIIFILLIIFIGLTFYIAVQPNAFEVKRTRIIKAPAEVIYNNVIDFKNWEAWSSWVEKDPETRITLGEKTLGVGGNYSWTDSNGPGNMKTIATTKNKTISQKLQFGDFTPSDINWTFSPTENGITEVTWKMNSDDIPFIFKASALFSGGFDSMIGPDFERGLEKLDLLILKSMEAYQIEIQGITNHGGGYYIYNTTSCKMDNFQTVMQNMLTKIGTYAQENSITMAGAPFISYHKWDEKNNAVMFSCCIPTTTQVITTQDDILTGQLEPFKSVKTTLKGNYTNLKEAWDKTMKYIPQNGLEFTEQGPMLEVYLTDPVNVPNPANWLTEIYIAVK